MSKYLELIKKNKVKTDRQPDIDICSECGEHCTFEDGEYGFESECCAASPVDTDPDIDMER